MLEGFMEIPVILGSTFMSLSNNGISFNKNVVIKIGSPSYVKFLINKETMKFALQVSDESNPMSVKFMRQGMDIKNGVRYHNKDIENMLSTMMNWDLEHYTYRIDGDFDEASHAMIFDLTRARTFNKRKRSDTTTK